MMPDGVYLKNGQISFSKLDGDELRVHPEVFGRMGEAIAHGAGSDTQRAALALRLAGLTDNEIAARVFTETKIVVDPTLVSGVPTGQQ